MLVFYLAASMNHVWLGHMRTESDRVVFTAGQLVKDGNGRKLNYPRLWPTPATTGHARLRVSRRGSLFMFCTAHGEQGEFQQPDSVDIGSDDVELVRFSADPGWMEPSRAPFSVVVLLPPAVKWRYPWLGDSGFSRSAVSPGCR